MTHITCRLTAKNRDQLRNPTLGNRVWDTFTFLCAMLCSLQQLQYYHHNMRLNGRCAPFIATARAEGSVKWSTCRTIRLWMANLAMMWERSRWPWYLVAGSTHILGSRHGHANVISRRSLLPCFLQRHRQHHHWPPCYGRYTGQPALAGTSS